MSMSRNGQDEDELEGDDASVVAVWGVSDRRMVRVRCDEGGRLPSPLSRSDRQSRRRRVDDVVSLVAEAAEGDADERDDGEHGAGGQR